VLHLVRMSVCLSVPCLLFSGNRKAVETYNLVETAFDKNGGANLSKVKVAMEENMEIVFRKKVDRFTSNHHRNDPAPPRPIIHTFHQQNCVSLLFVSKFDCLSVCLSVTYH